MVSASVPTTDPPQLRIVVRNTGAPLNGRTPAPETASVCRTSSGGCACYYGDAASCRLSRTDTGETVAELRLPLGDVAEDDLAAVTERDAGDAASRSTLIVADDERPAREFLTGLLKACAGVELVGEAASGEEALSP